MKIKSLKNLRWHYKTEVKKRADSRDSYTDPNFVGVYHDENGQRINGLFELFHGDKKIEKFLPSLLKIAEDGQAIYEFLQNAVDCNSSHFFIFYNEEYFLAVNNGEPFNHKDVLSILNIANTTKEYDCEKIGRFGIGFKLVHRLVGKNDGIDELTKDYRGPIIFSWSKIDELKQLLTKNRDNKGVIPVYPNFVKNQNDFDSEGSPWLFKIIATNFPAEPREEVYDINYERRVLFDNSELEDLVKYLKFNFGQHYGTFNFDSLNQGSLFFLKLGSGKKEHLDNDFSDLQKGVQYSMNFLRNLREVYINEHSLKKEELTLWEYRISQGTDAFNRINPEYRNCDIKITFGYTQYIKAEKLRNSPNFYKYFPMGDETNGFSFIVHCDSFDIEANRRKLHESDKNKNLLPEIARSIIETAEALIKDDIREYRELFANILLSQIPAKENNKWLIEYFISDLLSYITQHIPTKDGVVAESSHVIIKDINLDIDLADLGIKGVHWFFWEEENDHELTEEAQNEAKLSLEKWSIRNLLLSADLECLNSWIESLDNDTYRSFLEETDARFGKEIIERFCEAKIFKFSDGKFYSIEQAHKSANFIFLTKKTVAIQDELKALNFLVSEENISNYEFTTKITDKIKEDKEVFEEISIRTAEANPLTASQKKNLFKNFVNPETKFTDVGTESLKHLELFCNSDGKISPLDKLIPSSTSAPQWLNSYKITHDEYFEGLNKYLLQEAEIYETLILPQWDVIADNVADIMELYESTLEYFKLSESNTPFTDQKFVFIKQPDGRKKFMIAKKVFFNTSLAQSKNYYGLQTAIFSLTGFYTPSKEILQFFNASPFQLTSQDFCDLSSEEGLLDSMDIEALIESCIENRESFFEHYYLQQLGKQILVTPRDSDAFQVSPNKEAINFLKNNSEADEAITQFKILPYSFTKYNKEQGILYGEDFYQKLIDSLDVDSYRDQLIDVISYAEPKQKFLLNLSEIYFQPAKTYAQESFEYKVVDIAIKELTKSGQKEQFREKLTIRVNDLDIKVASIQSIGEITFGNHIVLKTAEVIPNSFQNSDELVDIVKSLASAGLPEQQLKDLFGIRSELDYNYVLNQIGLEIITGQQLLYLGLIGETTEINWSEYSFQLSDEEKLNVFRFLYSLYRKSKSAFSNKDWHKLLHIIDHDPLGFNPEVCVFADGYSLETERLPEFISSWIAYTEGADLFLQHLGIKTSSSFIVELRKHFHSSNRISVSQITQVGNEELLFNTLLWIKEKSIVIESDETFKSFEEIVNAINRIREDNNEGALVIKTATNFSALKSSATEWIESHYNAWKEELEDKYSIFLHEGGIPKLISLDEIQDYTFRKFNDGEIAINNENEIYINESEIHRIQGLLSTLVEEGKMEESDWRKLIIRMGGLHSGDSGISDEDRKLLEAVTEIGKPKIMELIELQKQLGNKDISKILAVGQQAFSNDGALFNSGYEGERIVYSDLKKRFSPERVRWTSAENPENSIGTDEYDFEILDNKKEKIILYVDAKSTTSKKYQTDKTEIYWRNSEWKFIEDVANSNYLIARVFNVNSDNPEIVYLKVAHDKNSV